MHLILLSGGSGKRLWPLSNDIRSKQFLQVLPGPDGQRESMVQRVYRQLREVGGWDSITVAAGSAQRDQLELQLGSEINVVIEPERRDTFPAIALACSYLYSELNVKPEEAVAVLPVDPYVDLEYFRNISWFEDLLAKSPDKLILMGAAPVLPSEKYGYIVPESHDEVSSVSYFKEKPERQLAEALIHQGALWNCGVFGIRLGYVLDILREKYHFNQVNYNILKEEFPSLNKTSFDYEVVEKAKGIQVLRYEGEWKDLGTWETLTEEMDTAIIGKAVIDELCVNTHVVNEQEIPVITMGISNAVVVASQDGILVAEKGETYRLKEFLADLHQRPMYEEKRWGEYKVIEHTTYEDGSEALTKKLSLQKGKQISYQYHQHRMEIWTIVRGTALLYLDGTKREIGVGDVIRIEKGQCHGISAVTDLEMIEVQLGNPLIEDDIVRLEMDWNEINTRNESSRSR